MAERRAGSVSASTVLRVLAALVFIGAGLRKLIGNGVVIEDFGRWNVPAPEVMVYVIGVLELTGGILLVAGLMPRIAAGVLGVDMAAAAVLAGPVDPIPHLVVPLALLAVCVLIYRENGRGRAILSPPWK